MHRRFLRQFLTRFLLQSVEKSFQSWLLSTWHGHWRMAVKMSLRTLLLVTLLVHVVVGHAGRASGSGMLTYSFDDGLLSVHQVALPILQSHNQVGTVNVVLDEVLSNLPNRLHTDHLFDLESKGWEICSHSITHPHFSKIPQTYGDEILVEWTRTSGMSHTFQCSYGYDELPFVLEDGQTLTSKTSIFEVEALPGSYYFDNENNLVYVHTMSQDDPSFHAMRSDSVERELEWSKLGLNDLGVAVQNFVVPYGEWNADRALSARNYYNSVACGGPTPNNPLPISNLWHLCKRVIKTDTSVDEVKDWIEQYVLEDETWLILTFHAVGNEVGWDSWPESNLEELSAWVESNGIMAVTHQQGLELGSTLIPMCECILTPTTTPTEIPRGEALVFQAAITNNTDQSGRVLFGSKVTTPSLQQIGWIFGPVSVYLSSHGSPSGYVSHTIPTTAPPGHYTYHGYVGTYGLGVIDECQFDFTVIDSGGNNCTACHG